MKRLKELCRERGVLQKDIATAIGIASNTFSQYANGNREPDYETLLRIADYFEVTTDYLLGRTNTPTEKIDESMVDVLQEIKDRSELGTLFSLSRNAKKEDVLLATQFLGRLAGRNNDEF